MTNTPQGGASEGNAADDALPVIRATFPVAIQGVSRYGWTKGCLGGNCSVGRGHVG